MRNTSIYILLLLSACRPRLNEQMIQQAVRANVQSYAAARHNECMQRHLTVASRRVDSLIRAYLQENLVTQDTLVPPPRPPKPVLTETPQPIDTMPVRPFFNEM